MHFLHISGVISLGLKALFVVTRQKRGSRLIKQMRDTIAPLADYDGLVMIGCAASDSVSINSGLSAAIR
jgi:hypothetical protein